MQTKQLSLSTARWIALALYVTGLVTYPIVGALVKTTPTLAAEVMRVLPVMLLGVGVADYLLSLVLEGMMLAQARKTGNPSGAANAVILTAAMGESLAVFGLVLALLGMGSWAVVLYALCFIHGVHLAVRWPNIERVTAGNDR